MSLEPGIYKATVRGNPDEIVMLTDATSDDPWVSMSMRGNTGVRWRWHQHDMVHGARPLIVLDLDQFASDVPKSFRAVAASGFAPGLFLPLAEQIEAQTKPPRIPEPGLWGVVEASATDCHNRRRYVRNGESIATCWHAMDSRQYRWDDLIDPVLIREGVTS